MLDEAPIHAPLLLPMTALRRSLSESLLGDQLTSSEEELEAHTCRPWRGPPCVDHDSAEASKAISRIGCWVGVNGLLWALLRVVSFLGVPTDGHDGWDLVWHFSSFWHLVLWSSLAGLFAHSHAPYRNIRLFGTPRRLGWFLIVAAGAGVTFGVASDTPALQESLSSHSQFDTATVVTLAILAGLAFFAIAWHAWHARRKRMLFAYSVPRLCVVAFFSVESLVLVRDGANFEFHHYWVAWTASLFFPRGPVSPRLYEGFDSAFSVFCLAVATGIFVQGLAAYDTAEIFHEA